MTEHKRNFAAEAANAEPYAKAPTGVEQQPEKPTFGSEVKQGLGATIAGTLSLADSLSFGALPMIAGAIDPTQTTQDKRDTFQSYKDAYPKTSAAYNILGYLSPGGGPSKLAQGADRAATGLIANMAEKSGTTVSGLLGTVAKGLDDAAYYAAKKITGGKANLSRASGGGFSSIATRSGFQGLAGGAQIAAENMFNGTPLDKLDDDVAKGIMWGFGGQLMVGEAIPYLATALGSSRIARSVKDNLIDNFSRAYGLTEDGVRAAFINLSPDTNYTAMGQANQASALSDISGMVFRSKSLGRKYIRGMEDTTLGNIKNKEDEIRAFLKSRGEDVKNADPKSATSKPRMDVGKEYDDFYAQYGDIVIPGDIVEGATALPKNKSAIAGGEAALAAANVRKIMTGPSDTVLGGYDLKTLRDLRYNLSAKLLPNARFNDDMAPATKGARKVFRKALENVTDLIDEAGGGKFKELNAKFSEVSDIDAARQVGKDMFSKKFKPKDVDDWYDSIGEWYSSEAKADQRQAFRDGFSIELTDSIGSNSLGSTLRQLFGVPGDVVKGKLGNEKKLRLVLGDKAVDQMVKVLTEDIPELEGFRIILAALDAKSLDPTGSVDLIKAAAQAGVPLAVPQANFTRPAAVGGVLQLASSGLREREAAMLSELLAAKGGKAKGLMEGMLNLAERPRNVLLGPQIAASTTGGGSNKPDPTDVLADYVGGAFKKLMPGR